jgi:antirestriction protein
MQSTKSLNMNLDAIQELWEEDSKIDEDNLHTESTKIPSLHAKYYKIFNNVLVLKKAQENKYKILKKEKWQYYSGKAEPEVYIEKPFDHKVLKPDLDKYMDADEDLIRCQTKIEYYSMMLDYLQSILKTILNRTYQLKNAIEWQRFIRGYD